ncbi:hypothetical protein VB773_10380 [Haloarculaceae archaeon H-GB2-1]|nr:hypothetical protein [Haloarculaceae archaeon H-GB1-1]MEA5386414.1 hypothetical protein [Haloarculaceae archaeon H-GB11]MEA5407924.1 hypothetical protein [Haloarculaceae archaeon H-GB2-1]
MTSTGYDPATVRQKLDAFPRLFGDDHRVVEIPDDSAAARGTHEPGETLFVARIVTATDAQVELDDVYRVTSRPDTTRSDDPADALYFVAKEWTDRTFDRDSVDLH